jgi:hypothetical protein
MQQTNVSSWYPKVARFGLISKGIVYCLTGVIAFMGAFEIGSSEEAGKGGVFHFIDEKGGGKPALLVIAVGLFCYCIWRLMQAFYNKGGSGDKKKDWSKRLRYFFSGLVYLSVAIVAVKIATNQDKSSGKNNEEALTAQAMDASFGLVLVGLAALIMAGVGIYQVWYGLSGKYRKHVQEMSAGSTTTNLLLLSGKLGYVARGIVWLILAWLLGKAALHSNSKEAGDTNEAFQALEDATMGSYYLGALGLGLICYGAFNFIRARYERLEAGSMM